MKKIISHFAGVLTIMTIMTTTVFATSGDMEQDVFSSLKEDIAIINQVSEEDLQSFAEENEEWIENVNLELENYLNTFPESERDDVIKQLQGVKANARAYSGNFEWYNYKKRGDYMTYSMYPKMSTRLLTSIGVHGWQELNRAYNNGLGRDGGSLYDQYWCHFDAKIEAEWNIEVGRPDVSYAQTLKSLCNPK